ncbi:MAG: 3(2),5-bisphosphate nucleotidase CysQ [Caulobacteraceae bacterium]|nr:3(2),5-bisphosphate nucleotidase CysQ [Caulobacteraceae bacterium]
MTPEEAFTDLVLIEALARHAGDMALTMREAGITVSSKPGGSPVTDADVAVDHFLRDNLLAARPGYGWLSEEIADVPERLESRRLFIVDPIDGTSAYLRGKPWFAVSVAVVVDGAPVAGVVHAPAVGETYSASIGGGARLNGQPIRTSTRTELEGAQMLGDPKLFADPRWPIPWPPMTITGRNSVAYRMALVAAGTFDAAFAPSGKSDWDIAAADLIAREAGAVCVDGEGRRFVYNRPDPRHAGLICAPQALASLILDRTRRNQSPH